MSIHISLSPNTQKDDLLLALKLLLSLYSRSLPVKDYEEVGNNLIEDFKKYQGVKHANSFNSGRSALMAILYALGIKESDEVLIQAFTCNAVPNPVLWAQATPIYVDIEETLNMDPTDLEFKVTLRQTQGGRPKAVIVQHTFGIPADMDRILDVARRHNLIVIEDCAHALGARYKGRLVGTLGDASFFSFGRDKVISSVYGGMAATNNPAIAKKIEEFWNQCEYPSHSWIFQQLMHPIIFAAALPLYNILNIGKILIRMAQKIKLLSLAVTKAEKNGEKPPYFPKRMPHALASLARHQFLKLEEFNAHRREIANFYLQHITSSKYQIINIPSFANECVFLRFSFFHLQRDAILQRARKQDMYLGDWYTSVVAPYDTDLGKMKYTKGICPKAEEAAKTIFNLPTHINISMEDAARIVNFLNGYT